MKDAGKLYGHSVYFTAILYFQWPFGIICGFGMLYQYKSGNPG
jgi:hypothetical protein